MADLKEPELLIKLLSSSEDFHFTGDQSLHIAKIAIWVASLVAMKRIEQNVFFKTLISLYKIFYDFWWSQAGSNR